MLAGCGCVILPSFASLTHALDNAMHSQLQTSSVREVKGRTSCRALAFSSSLSESKSRRFDAIAFLNSPASSVTSVIATGVPFPEHGRRPTSWAPLRNSSTHLVIHRFREHYHQRAIDILGNLSKRARHQQALARAAKGKSDLADSRVSLGEPLRAFA